MLSLNEEESQILARKLADIKRACLEIKESASGLSIRDIAYDREKWQSITRNIGIIGEAVRKLLPFDHDTKRSFDRFRIMCNYPEIPLKQIIGAREFVIHDYGNINYAIIQDIIANGVPQLLNVIERISIENHELGNMINKNIDNSFQQETEAIEKLPSKNIVFFEIDDNCHNCKDK